jgi:hypothetical protein
MIGDDQPRPGSNPTFEGMCLRFYTRTVRDEERSRAEGREVSRQAEWVKINRSGDKGTVIAREVTDLERATAQYKCWKVGRTWGIPLSAWEETADEDRIQELNACGVYTVEDVAALGDNANVPGKFALRQRAREFLATRATEAAQAVHDDRDARILALERLAQEQSQKIAELLAVKSKEDGPTCS